METEQIVKGLRGTIYKFTYAHKIRSQIKLLDKDERDAIRAKIKTAIGKPEYQDISDVLKQILT